MKCFSFRVINLLVLDHVEGFPGGSAVYSLLRL